MHDSERVPAPPGSLVRPGEDWASLPPTIDRDWVPARDRARPRSSRPWVHLVLFLATVLTTTGCGVGHYLSFSAGFAGHAPSITPSAILAGFWYSGTVLAILGCHEMGHYIACRLYGIDATLPFFLPGANRPDRHVRRSHSHSRHVSGSPVAVRRRYCGTHRGFCCRGARAFSRTLAVASRGSAGTALRVLELGEPLLFKAAAGWSGGTSPTGSVSTCIPWDLPRGSG